MTTPGDEGLQPERTQLAWQRSAIGVVLGCSLLSLTASRQGDVVVAVAAALVAAVALWLALSAAARRRLVVQHPPWEPLLATSCVVVAMGLLGTIVALRRIMG